MNTSPCDQLDGYLADWLAERERAAYEAHLADCHACRDQINLQRHIDHLLEQGVEQLEPISPSLIDSIEARIQRFQRRRTVRRVSGLAAAAVALILAGMWFVRPKPTRLPKAQAVARKQDVSVGRRQSRILPTRSVSQPNSPVRITPSDPSSAIVVPVATDDPNVTFVWYYPTVKSASGGNGLEAN